MKRPSISIITVCYNSEDYIARTINSVLMQTYKDYEYIIVDGDSKDNTLNIIKDFHSSNLTVYSEPDKGISDAFNKGIKYSKGEYLCFLNSGDYFIEKNILENVAKDLRIYSEEIISYSITSIMNSYFPKNVKEGDALWKDSMIPHQGCFVSRHVFEKVGNFNLHFKVRMDYDFFTRCYIQEISYRCIPRIIVYYDSSGVSTIDQYNVHKEGMAVRLLYKSEVSQSELGILQYLISHGEKSGNDVNELEEQRNLADKHFKIMMAMNSWIHSLQNGKHANEYFERRSIRSIAIYGWGYLGRCLANELHSTNIIIKYVIDINKEKLELFKIYDWNDPWEDVDAIIVTPFYEYQTIKKRIKEKKICKVISIEEIIKGD